MPKQKLPTRNLILLSLFILLPIYLSAQIENIFLDKSYSNLNWVDFVNKVEASYPVHFYYDTDSVVPFEVILSKDKMTLMEVLDKGLEPYSQKVSTDREGNIFITKIFKVQTNLPEKFLNRESTYQNQEQTNMSDLDNADEFLNTDNAFISKSRVVGKKTNDNKKTAVITGYIKSANNGSPIIGGTLLIKETGKGAITNNSGFYTLFLKKGNYTLIVNSVESKEEQIKLEVLSDGRLDLLLEPKLIALDEIIVSSEKDHIVKSNQMGYQKLETKEIKEIPLVLGERDIVKVSLLLPGIQSVGEGASGFNVRGSPTDQNLFIINNVPIYNSSHLFGFFSAFNSDAIKSFSLYKSNIPANFGGRLSSIFDVKTKQGNKKDFTANGGISPITTRLLFEGPIQKKKSSYLIGLRSTYSDWLLKQVNNPDIRNSNAYFADAVTNFSFELNENNQINLFTYNSFDNINIINQNKYKYTNFGGAIGWNHLIKEKHMLQFSLLYSQYDFSEENSEVEISAYKDNFDLKHSEFKANIDIRPNAKHNITAGVNSAFYIVDQGVFLPLTDQSLIEPVKLIKEQGIESGIYLADEWVISPNLSVTGGIRYNSYLYLGPQDVKIYNENVSKTNQSIIDTVSFGNNEIAKSYGAPDLRFAARYIITDNLSVKLSFNQLQQYLFMLTNTIAISPTDKWKLCDNNIKPLSGNQYSFGIYNTFANDAYNISIETYYKTIDNLVEYKDGANLVVSESPEMDVLQGKLSSFGVEFMIKKTSGRFNGWLNYTYSKADVIVNSNYSDGQINYGQSFPANYDKPHAVNIVTNYKFSRRFSVSSNLVYSTGRPITYPVGFFYQDQMRIPLYSKRNEYRLPDYFRADFSLKIEGNLYAKKFAHSTWIFSVYNLTGRRNAYSVFFKSEEGELRGYKLSIFGVPIVSLTYSFKLGNYAN